MIEPPPASRMAGITDLVPKNTPVELMFMMLFQSSSDVCSMGTRW